MVQNLPSAKTYQREAIFMPWGKLLTAVLAHAATNTPKGGRVLDMMCGTGNLLGRLYRLRPDLECVGVDCEPEYIAHAEKENPGITFFEMDAFNFFTDFTDRAFDAVLCTGGLHHIPWGFQDDFLFKLSTLVRKDGFALVGDPYISSYAGELERRENAAQLGYEYLLATMRKNAPNDVVKAAADLIANDILGVEFKTSIEFVAPLFEKHFSETRRIKTWPSEPGTGYGDYLYICKSKQ